MTLGPRTRLLLSLASDSLGQSAAPALLPGGRHFDDLAQLLQSRNGFYAFESALHVFGIGRDVSGGSLLEWNDPHSWRAEFDGMTDGYLFFAEDVFGSQFAVDDDGIVTFDPEIGEIQPFASSIEDWSDQLLADHEVLTGFPVAHAWQERNGQLAPGLRLVPRRPFVLGGDFDEQNVYPIDAVQGMRLRAELARQIRDHPDGTRVTYRIVE